MTQENSTGLTLPCGVMVAEQPGSPHILGCVTMCLGETCVKGHM